MSVALTTCVKATVSVALTSSLIFTIHSVSPAKEVTSTAEKKRDSNGLRESNGLSPPSESNEIFRFYNAGQNADTTDVDSSGGDNNEVSMV